MARYIGIEDLIDYAKKLDFEAWGDKILLPLGTILDTEYGLAIGLNPDLPYDPGDEDAKRDLPWAYIKQLNKEPVFGHSIMCYTPSIVVNTLEFKDKVYVAGMITRREHEKKTGLMLAVKSKEFGTLNPEFLRQTYHRLLDLLPEGIATELISMKCEELVDKLQEIGEMELPGMQSEVQAIKQNLVADISIYADAALHNRIKLDNGLKAKIVLAIESAVQWDAMGEAYEMGDLLRQRIFNAPANHVLLANQIVEFAIDRGLEFYPIQSMLMGTISDARLRDNTYATITRNAAKNGNYVRMLAAAGKISDYALKQGLLASEQNNIVSIANNALTAGNYVNFHSSVKCVIDEEIKAGLMGDANMRFGGLQAFEKGDNNSFCRFLATLRDKEVREELALMGANKALERSDHNLFARCMEHVPHSTKRFFTDEALSAAALNAAEDKKYGNFDGFAMHLEDAAKRDILFFNVTKFALEHGDYHEFFDLAKKIVNPDLLQGLLTEENRRTLSKLALQNNDFVNLQSILEGINDEKFRETLSEQALYRIDAHRGVPQMEFAVQRIPDPLIRGHEFLIPVANEAGGAVRARAADEGETFDNFVNNISDPEKKDALRALQITKAMEAGQYARLETVIDMLHGQQQKDYLRYASAMRALNENYIYWFDRCTAKISDSKIRDCLYQTAAIWAEQKSPYTLVHTYQDAISSHSLKGGAYLSRAGQAFRHGRYLRAFKFAFAGMANKAGSPFYSFAKALHDMRAAHGS